MRGRITLPALVAIAVVAGCGGHKRTAPPPDATAGTPIVTKSADSEAPKNAPAHWLPPEAWVYNHWLPYDETRLYRLLGITRVGLWLQLRDDHLTLAPLAAPPPPPPPPTAGRTPAAWPPLSSRPTRRGSARGGRRCCARGRCAPSP